MEIIIATVVGFILGRISPQTTLRDVKKTFSRKRTTFTSPTKLEADKQLQDEVLSK